MRVIEQLIRHFWKTGSLTRVQAHKLVADGFIKHEDLPGLSRGKFHLYKVAPYESRKTLGLYHYGAFPDMQKLMYSPHYTSDELWHAVEEQKDGSLKHWGVIGGHKPYGHLTTMATIEKHDGYEKAYGKHGWGSTEVPL